jgi:hypothetical protein
VRRLLVAALTVLLACPANATSHPSPAPSTAPLAAPSASPAALPGAEIPPLYVRGQVLTISGGFCIFTTGDGVRVDPALVVPKGVKTGSYVRVTIDQVSRAVVAIELEPKVDLAGEVEVANIPRQYVVVSPKSAPAPAPSGQAGTSSSGPVTVTIVVHVPGNTPTSDTVYLSTDRSSYSSAEIPMNRVDGTTFRVPVTLPAGTGMKYMFTRGTYATVERDRTGGIVTPRTVNAIPNTTTDDTVARWADLS